jgi:hypothetical protein
MTVILQSDLRSTSFQRTNWLPESSKINDRSLSHNTQVLKRCLANLEIRDALDIRPNNPAFLKIRPDTGFGGRISGQIPDTGTLNSQISGQSFNHFEKKT